MIFKRLFEKICRERLTAAIATLYEVNSFRLETIEEEIEQLQSDDNYVKNLALENKETIEENSILISQILEVISIAQSNREGLITLVKLQSENMLILKKKVEDIEKALTILLK